MSVAVNLIGLALIILTYWFFFAKKESKAVEAGKEIEILVEGGYKPDVIEVKKGEPVTLKFNRKDESSCLEEVVLSDFNVREYLPLNETTEIEITPEKAGEFDFTCGMNMFHGKLIVKE